MQANDDNQDEDDALEGLAQLEQQNPYAGAPIHKEEQFRDSNLVNSATFDKSLLWKPFATSKDAYAALELESFVENKKNGIYQLVRSGNQCRVVCRGDVGRIKWNKELKKHQPIGRNICSYHAHIRKIRPKDGHHHWIIDPKHTKLEHSKRCLLGTRRCPSVTTVRKRILKNLETVRAFTDRKTRGREVKSSIQVNSQRWPGRTHRMNCACSPSINGVMVISNTFLGMRCVREDFETSWLKLVCRIFRLTRATRITPITAGCTATSSRSPIRRRRL